MHVSHMTLINSPQIHHAKMRELKVASFTLQDFWLEFLMDMQATHVLK